ncbi:MAG: phosphatidylglycerol lysyltransferase domain-containing protein [Pseudomonadota bacterium]
MATTTAKGFLRAHLLRGVPPAIILALCAVWLAPYLTPATLSTIAAQVSGISLGAWGLALTATACSFWAVGRYDAIAHRHLRTGVNPGAARLGGSAAIALGQTLGLGVVTGALVRWRIFSDLNLGTAAALSAFVSVSFVGAWGLVTALACLLLPSPGWTFWPAVVGIVLSCTGVWAAFRHPVLRWRRWSFHAPTLKAMGAMALLAALDTGFAALALFVLLPAGAEIAFGALLPLFLLALGAALISNTPGGVGPFELMLLTLLPAVPEAQVLGSIVAFRMVYYAMPALLALVALIRPLPAHPSSVAVPHAGLLAQASRAELGIIRQNGGALLASDDGCIATWQTGQTLTALFDPVRGTPASALAALTHAASATNRLPVIYKCRRSVAAAARRAGWSVLHSADEAMVHTAGFDLARPALRTLRRKLRGAAKSGVVIRMDVAPTNPHLAVLDREWQDRNGPARGGTMGRFNPAYIAHQMLCVAEVNGIPVAFVTFHRSTQEWCLDLMRGGAAAPAGTMHALVHSGIEAAAAAGVPRVSLAANIACPNPQSAIWRAITFRAVAHSQDAGLRQFKSSFAPTWTPRYVAAQGAFSLVLALIDIAREVHFPDPVAPLDMHGAHKHVDDYELASETAA